MGVTSEAFLVSNVIALITTAVTHNRGSGPGWRHAGDTAKITVLSVSVIP